MSCPRRGRSPTVAARGWYGVGECWSGAVLLSRGTCGQDLHGIDGHAVGTVAFQVDLDGLSSVHTHADDVTSVGRGVWDQLPHGVSLATSVPGVRRQPLRVSWKWTKPISWKVAKAVAACGSAVSRGSGAVVAACPAVGARRIDRR